MENFITQNLREELINELMRTMFKDEPEKREYLQMLCEDKLDKMVGEYYLHHIIKKNN